MPKPVFSAIALAATVLIPEPKIDQAVAGIVAAIEDGLYQPGMKARMAELERERIEIAARLAEATQAVPDVHRGIAEIYKRKFAQLTTAVADPETRLDISSDIRPLVGKIVSRAAKYKRPSAGR